ncbi:Scr1 family TA system antitoxin-like transcriptional regulator [Streptomyces sp. NPDC055109]
MRRALHGLETAYRSCKRQLGRGHRTVQESHAVQEAQAKTVHLFESGTIPGIFQTPHYARGVLTDVSARLGTPRDIEDGVRARMKRQDALYEPGRHFHALMWEGHGTSCGAPQRPWWRNSTGSLGARPISAPELRVHPSPAMHGRSAEGHTPRMTMPARPLIIFDDDHYTYVLRDQTSGRMTPCQINQDSRSANFGKARQSKQRSLVTSHGASRQKSTRTTRWEPHSTRFAAEAIRE